jgi:Lon protease-like protein
MQALRPFATGALTARAPQAPGALTASAPRAPRPAARRAAVAVAAAARGRLPIFPLGLVALPAADVPLQIFEARYRVLFSTLLAGEAGIEDGLVSPDKPWAGSKRFGMCFADPRSRGVSAVGTVLEVRAHALLPDGRLVLETRGAERFRITEVVEERPVLVCDVEFLEDAAGAAEEEAALAEEVATLFRQVVRLSTRVRDAGAAPPELADPEQLRTLAPREVSFWVASVLGGSPHTQQQLLEEDSTAARLTAEKEVLEASLKYLSAQAALSSVFSPGGGEGEAPAAPAAGGPD